LACDVAGAVITQEERDISAARTSSSESAIAATTNP